MTIYTDSPGWQPQHIGVDTDSPGWISDRYEITLGGISIYGREDHRQPDIYGYRLTLLDLSGWDDLADDATRTYRHWSGDGQAAGARRLGHRVITMSLLAEGVTRAGRGSWRQALADLKALPYKSILSSVDYGLGQAVEADVRVVTVLPGRPSRWESVITLSLVADDPLRHSSRQMPVQTGRIANTGDQTAWPLIAVSGTDAITITHPGGTFRLTGVPSHGCLIDSRNGEVWTASGKARLHGLNSGPWPRVEPGGSDWTVASAGTSTMTRTEAWS